MTAISTIGKRLIEERIRLGFNQTNFAAIAGAGRTSQVSYETDKRRPDADYLAAIASAGADVLYILTGRRIEGTLLPEALTLLTPDEVALVDNYRNSPESAKKNIREVGAAFAQQNLAQKRQVGEVNENRERA
ncbi:Transcriptional regulator [Gammaproteobacteria bacterium]